ncbi:hypothetical protein Dsin_001763 [Dipteronia sinensis]|uniref:DUF4283 domain-containing protein n=1 Tax=Dipteronia sinensis TaxID=43782 RepID=A0AAE0EJA8_9ROSI|nr:hypothetical protein Dsin_001763 [Dipteronia sinensis]
MKGTKNQCNRSEKLALGAHRPDQLQLVLSTSFGNVEKPASKGAACPSANVEGQLVQLEEVSSLRNSELPHTKGSVSPPMEVAEDGSKAWKNCLVGYFIEKKLPFSLVNNIAMRLWGNRGLQEVLANDKGFFFFKFLDDEACSNVLESGLLLFAGRMVILKKWHPRLILTKETYSKIPVWVKLFNIPHELWNEEGLSHIASAVEKPLYADSLTESMKRISYARVCIEIDATFEYQWKPKICTECKFFGHSITTCPKLKPLHPPSVMDFDPKPKQEWRRVTMGVATQIPLPCMNLEPLPLDEVISVVNSETEPYLCPTNLPIKIQCNDLSKESIVDILLLMRFDSMPPLRRVL